MNGAIKVYQQALQLDPQNKEIYSALSTAYQNIQLNSDAINVLERAIQLFPTDISLKLKLAQYFISQNNIPEAIDLLDRAIEVDPLNAGVQLEVARILQSQGLLDSAFNAYKLALDLDSSLIDAKVGIAAINLRREDFLSAIIGYRELAELLPNNPDVYYNLGLSLRGRSRMKEAKEAWETSIQLYQLQGDRNAVARVEALMKKF
ncbi:MAG: tetratricopeptide repeat protein [Synechococcaceae cyanobacterium RL_1_2]|nr:tetratricopeptide repeat protein [Synechococcaceae cyanobacterium RL_1_2]